MESLLYQNPVPYVISDCGFFLGIFSEQFHFQTGACKVDFSPVLLRPARRILLRSIWGVALPKGVIAERTYIYVRGETTLQ